MIYAVCTSCAFLRAYSASAGETGSLEACPACGGELIVREQSGRFPPAYVSRVSLEVLAEPELKRDEPSSPADRAP